MEPIGLAYVEYGAVMVPANAPVKTIAAAWTAFAGEHIRAAVSSASGSAAQVASGNIRVHARRPARTRIRSITRDGGGLPAAVVLRPPFAA